MLNIYYTRHFAFCRAALISFVIVGQRCPVLSLILGISSDLCVTTDEEQRARHPLLPPTFLCGISSDFNTELQKLQQAQVTCASDLHIAASPVCSTAPVLQVKPSHDAAAVDTSGGGAEERQTDTPAAPIDLSTKRSSESDSSTATGE